MNSPRLSSIWSACAVALFIALPGCAVDASDTTEDEAPVEQAASAIHAAQHHGRHHTFEGTHVEGSFSCDFGLAPGPIDQIPALIERDRMYMAARPGLVRKELPIVFDPNTGATFSGGRYLFDTYENAVHYKSWVQNDFVLDGVEFLSRPIFLSPECHAWELIGIHEFAPMETSQFVYRTERWSVPHHARAGLEAAWSDLRDAAGARGLSSVWLTYSESENLVQLVYFADRVGPADPNVPDFASLGALRDGPALGDGLAHQSWSKTFDRTQWVLTDWYPFAHGDTGKASLWPNSPPFPQPSCGDGVCEVSRGENHASCPADCTAKCGNSVCNAGEDTHTCPGDCRI